MVWGRLLRPRSVSLNKVPAMFPTSMFPSFSTPHNTRDSQQVPSSHDPRGDRRLARMECKEPTRRLLRDVMALRRIRGMSQTALAAQLGISVRTLQEWEQGRRLPSGVGHSLLKQWVETQQSDGG